MNVNINSKIKNALWFIFAVVIAGESANFEFIAPIEVDDEI